MDAVYVSANSFRVFTDLTADFVAGRRVRVNLGGSGYVYATIVGSNFVDPNTVVEIDEEVLTSDLFEVHYGLVSPGANGSLPVHNHSADEGQGGEILLGSMATKAFWKGTQAEYTALGSWSDDTIYFIVA